MNVDKNEFLRDEDVLPEKAATIIDNLFIAAIIDNNKEDGDNREENKNGEYNISEGFEAILKNIKTKNHGKNINLHPLMIKSLNAENRCSKKVTDLMKHLIFLLEKIVDAINLMSIKLRLLIRLIQKM